MSLILLFVKNPIPGQVKTRLAQTMGTKRALQIYDRLLAHTRDIAQKTSFTKVVFYGNKIPPHDLWSEAGFARHPQSGEELGARMAHAFAWGFDQGHQKIVIVGSDCAQLQTRHLEEAFAALEAHDTVMGPARDGGYYLLGLKEMHSQLFKNKNWSTSSVFKDSIRDLLTANKSVYLLEALADVDTEADLRNTFLEAEFLGNG